MAISDCNAEFDAAGSPKAIFPFKAGLRRSSKLSIFISPARFLLTIMTVGSAKAGEKYPVLLRNASIIFASSGETYSIKRSFCDSSVI